MPLLKAPELPSPASGAGAVGDNRAVSGVSEPEANGTVERAVEQMSGQTSNLISRLQESISSWNEK
jgi:hypothetical protein